MSDPHTPETRKDEASGAGGPIVALVDRLFEQRSRILPMVAAICAVLFIADFTYHKHVYMDFLNTPLIYVVAGFGFFAGVVLLARVLGALTSQPEDFYAPYAIDAEENGPHATGRDDDETREGGHHG